MPFSLSRLPSSRRRHALRVFAAVVATCALAPGCNGDGPMEPPDTEGPTVTLDAVPSLTNQASVTVAGSTESDADVEITGGVGTTTGTANDAGRFSIIVTLQRNQTNNLSVVAADSLGNRGPPATATVEHDDTPPPPPTITVPEFTNQSDVTVEGTTEPGATVRVHRGSVTEQGSADASGAFSISIALAANVANTLTVTAEDEAGNEGSPTNATVTHDDVPPSVTVVSPAPGSTTPAPPTSFPIDIDYSDGGSGIDTSTLQLEVDRNIVGLLQQDGTDIADIPAGTNLLEIAEILSGFVITPTGADWDFDATRWALAEGANVLSASIADRAGNTSIPDSVGFDATAPLNHLLVIFAGADPGTSGNILPVGLSNFEELAGVSFTLNFDPGVITVDSVKSTGHVTIPAESDADTEGDTGAVKTIVIDIGGDLITPGADISLEFYVTVAPGAPSGDTPITFSEVAISAANGNPAGFIATDGTLTIN